MRISDWSSDVCSSDLLIADDEQPDREELGAQPALHRLPNLFPGERQLPSGPGLPPPSEPSLPGMEPDLPATQQPEPDPAMQEELSQLVTGLGNKLRASEKSPAEIGRPSCRERMCLYVSIAVVAASLQKTNKKITQQ